MSNQTFSYTPISPRWARNDRPACNRVMVVESDPTLRAEMRAILRDLRCEIFEVHCGSEALALLGAGFRGTIILDGCLPDADGATVFERIRRADPSLPVIFAAEDLTVRSGLDRVRDDAFAFCEAGEIVHRLPTLLPDALLAMGHAVTDREQPFVSDRVLRAVG